MSLWQAKGKRTSGRGWSFLRLLFPVFSFIVVSSALLGGGYAFSRYLRDSDDYHVQFIEIGGTNILTAEEVMNASQVTTADNLLFLNPVEIEERVTRLPRIESCKVTRVFPNVITLLLSCMYGAI